MSVIIGIDVGGSTTKIVGFRKSGDKNELITPQFVRANDQVTSCYGAFGKFTDENRIALCDIDRVMMTGVGSSFIQHSIYGLECTRVPEFTSIGRGGLFLSELDDALIVSMGTGTALVHAVDGGKMDYLGGTGVGGGTLTGLSRLLLKLQSVPHIFDLAKDGNLENVDLCIRDITAKNGSDALSSDLTAANFGKISDLAKPADLAAGILNLVFETVGMISVFGARSVGVKNVVLTGNLTAFAPCREKFKQFNRMYEEEGLHFSTPELSQFATVIGTALCGLTK